MKTFSKVKSNQIVFHPENGLVFTKGTPPYAKAKWCAVPYTLPDGKTGTWWQPYHPIIYKATDISYSRARARLARILNK